MRESIGLHGAGTSGGFWGFQGAFDDVLWEFLMHGLALGEVEVCFELPLPAPSPLANFPLHATF